MALLKNAEGALQSERDRLADKQAQYSDLLIQWSVPNDYSSLSNRTLQTLVYINQAYNFTFLLKKDNDMFLNTPVILSKLSTIMPQERLYWGRSSCYNPVRLQGHWKETKWRLCDTYYPYHYGGMYVLTHDLVQLIAENTQYLQTYTCEDVSVGAWLAPYNIHRIDDVRIFVDHSAGTCSRGFIAVHIHHQLSHKKMRQFYDNLKREGVICTDVRKEYPMSWNTLPQKCLTESVAVT